VQAFGDKLIEENKYLTKDLSNYITNVYYYNCIFLQLSC